MGVYVGDTKSLVFPVLCDGHIQQKYLDHNTSTTALTNRHGHWGLDEFAIEAIITPYDINGYGSKTASSYGVLDSIKTVPSLGVGASNPDNYQSYDYFNTNRLTHKMMLFHNTKFSLYLQNTAGSNINRPAEYKIVAAFADGSAVVETDTVISGTNRLFSYTDANSYYDSGDATTLRKISSTATNVSPHTTITIGSNTLQTNITSVAATGTITMTGAPETYYPAQSATATITANNNNFSVDTLPTVGTGAIKFGANPSIATASTTSTEYIQVTNQDSTVTKWFSGDGSSPTWVVDSNGFLNTLYWPANSRTYRNAASAELTLVQFVAGVNAYNAGWSGTVTVGADPLDESVNPPAIVATFVTAITGTTPNRTGANGVLTIGAGMASGIVRTQISGGTAENVVTNNYITVVENGRTRRYHPYPNSSDYFSGQQITRSGVSIIVFEKRANANATLQQLAVAINHTNGNTGITASVGSSDVLTLTDDSAGVSSYTLTNTSNMSTVLSTSNWSGGEAASQPSKYIQVQDSNNVVTKFHPVHQTKSGINNASTFSYGGNTFVAYVYEPSGYINNFITAFNSVTALDITAGSQSGTTIPLTQGTAGTSGDKAISNEGPLSNVSVSGLSGGVNSANPTNAITLANSVGLVKKYKASINESTATTDNTYVFFEIGASTTITANNLVAAINSVNGHNGTITATNPSSNNIVKVQVGFGSNYSISNSISNISVTSWVTTGGNNVIVTAGETSQIGEKEELYNSNGKLIGTVASSTGTVMTLTGTAVNPVTSTVYASQPREALYLESMIKVSCILSSNGHVRIFLNNKLVKSSKITFSNGFSFAPSDCYIGNDGTNKNTQFMGELYEIAMYKRQEPTINYATLSPGYSDIIFYYRFGDE